jgi:hypothetical protein
VSLQTTKKKGKQTKERLIPPFLFRSPFTPGHFQVQQL